MENKIWKEKDFEEKMRPALDSVYKSIFKDKLKDINRINRDSEGHEKILDQHFAIDTILKTTDGQIFTIQEKTLKNNQAVYSAVTFEYYDDPINKKEGDWFNLAAQFYFFCYANANEKGYENWWLIDVAKLRLYLLFKEENIFKYLRYNSNSNAKANFFAIPLQLCFEAKAVIFYKKKF